MISFKDIGSEVSAPSMNHFLLKPNAGKTFCNVLTARVVVEAESDGSHHQKHISLTLQIQTKYILCFCKTLQYSSLSFLISMQTMLICSFVLQGFDCKGWR